MQPNLCVTGIRQEAGEGPSHPDNRMVFLFISRKVSMRE
ncbi:hypothetical protein PM3016_4651 [Paenibacillus mucilaginosus 3016]|uniref:Uncharacterized protein n=1 Tax=Paenibacillus mucilaginosus 3016 TaxID=1116391 RepID=H6NFX8_9BACL|nr:hypothetical protein PM3016_4651 [Paenibacillus mucilaginosus 3016]